MNELLMKNFEQPKIEVLALSVADVITTSDISDPTEDTTEATVVPTNPGGNLTPWG